MHQAREVARRRRRRRSTRSTARSRSCSAARLRLPRSLALHGRRRRRQPVRRRARHVLRARRSAESSRRARRADHDRHRPRHAVPVVRRERGHADVQHHRPGDGDQPSCNRERTDWRRPRSVTILAPVDNLGLFGWKSSRSGSRKARSLGWPMHAIGDAVAPHHVLGTTGWGATVRYETRRAELAARPLPGRAAGERPARRAVRATAPHRRQGFAYWRYLAGAARDAPGDGELQPIPIRAFVTEIARRDLCGRDHGRRPAGVATRSDAVGAVLGRPGRIARVLHRAVHTDDDDVVRARGRCSSAARRNRRVPDRGRTARRAVRSADVVGSAGATFPECGASRRCSAACCVPDLARRPTCFESCSYSGCTETVLQSTCSTARRAIRAAAASPARATTTRAVPTSRLRPASAARRLLRPPGAVSGGDVMRHDASICPISTLSPAHRSRLRPGARRGTVHDGARGGRPRRRGVADARLFAEPRRRARFSDPRPTRSPGASRTTAPSTAASRSTSTAASSSARAAARVRARLRPASSAGASHTCRR